MNLIFVGHRCCDHSPSSGYDQICTLFPDAGWLDGPSLAKGSIRWERRPVEFDESNLLLHVFYGDCSGSALPAILRTRFPRATIVSTLHRPVRRILEDREARASLDVVDGVVVVSHEQARQLAQVGLAAPIFVVPHGVWTSVFRPSPTSTPAGRDNALLVGTYLRDWPGANRIVSLLAERGVPSLVLGSSAGDHLEVMHPLVRTSPRVGEAELVQLYHRASALVLPVLDLTASNALLEAMAAGCPVICPRLPAAAEYLPDGSDTYSPGDYDAAAASAAGYHMSHVRRANRSRQMIEHAARFDWNRLRLQIQAVYQTLLSPGLGGAVGAADGSAVDFTRTKRPEPGVKSTELHGAVDTA